MFGTGQLDGLGSRMITNTRRRAKSVSASCDNFGIGTYSRRVFGRIEANLG
jgi:hypothetical protein